MTKNQILEAVNKLSKLDRDEILQAIVNSNMTEDYLISSEQQKELNKRRSDINNDQTLLSDGKLVMDTMANKYGI